MQLNDDREKFHDDHQRPFEDDLNDDYHRRHFDDLHRRHGFDEPHRRHMEENMNRRQIEDDKRDILLCEICNTYLPSIDDLQVHLLTEHYENEQAQRLLGIIQ